MNHYHPMIVSTRSWKAIGKWSSQQFCSIVVSPSPVLCCLCSAACKESELILLQPHYPHNLLTVIELCIPFCHSFIHRVDSALSRCIRLWQAVPVPSSLIRSSRKWCIWFTFPQICVGCCWSGLQVNFSIFSFITSVYTIIISYSIILLQVDLCSVWVTISQWMR
jgi:hypothetical protein